MQSNTRKGLDRPSIGRRGPWLVPSLLVFAWSSGCAGERREITPTTLGTDFSKAPRGKMIPFPWPGQSIVKSPARSDSPGSVDPQASLASGERPPG
jgi:hypothetical protein